jgi:hypothetical protein
LTNSTASVVPLFPPQLFHSPKGIQSAYNALVCRKTSVRTASITTGMDDAVRASNEDVTRTLAISRHTWSSYNKVSNAEWELSPECVQPQKMLGKVPAYLAHGTYKGDEAARFKIHHQQLWNGKSELFVSGRSAWQTSDGTCDLGPKVMPHKLLLGVQCSTSCVFTNSDFESWPGVQGTQDRAVQGNFVAVLTLAWAYILSAQWLEIQRSHDSSTCSSRSHIQYLDHQVQWFTGCQGPLTDELELDLNDVSDDAARWWSAILAPGEGWQATISREGQNYKSPWSTRLAATQPFILRRTSSSLPGQTDKTIPPSSTEALNFLSSFCETRDIRGQCCAALSAALYFPFLNGSTAILPLPRTYARTQAATSAESSNKSSPRDIIMTQSTLLPFYLTLSSNRRGMQSLLNSTFFASEVSCNLVSAWLQPVFDIIDPIMNVGDYRTLAMITTKRQPKLAGLWLGAILTGAVKRILQDLRNGMSSLELNAAAWTATTHSFITIRPSTPRGSLNEIPRADECRLLFLSGHEGYSRVPICPWKPFGTTPICDTEIEVQLHAHCKGHCMLYLYWSWDLEGEGTLDDAGFNNDADDADYADRPQCTQTDIPLMAQNREPLKSEVLSELATRSIFGWLRVTGYPKNEARIRKHVWLDLEDTDEEMEDDADSENDPKETVRLSNAVDKWLRDDE